jgi:hypothetical protein
MVKVFMVMMSFFQAFAQLPTRVDNTTLKYFRPIYSQKDNSCGQASGIGYIFTYEINRVRDLQSNKMENQYPSHFTWLMLNGATNNGSTSTYGWLMAQDIGVPDLANYYRYEKQSALERMNAFGFNQMSGYDKWYNALQNKVESRVSFKTKTYPGSSYYFDPEIDFIKAKEWLAHHGKNEATGGLLSIWGNSSALKGGNATGVKTIPSGNPGAGKKIIIDFGGSGGHLMTIAGYDDEIGYDLNGDGQITNDIDINSDGVIDRKDWEKGAFLLVNTWGTDWADDGKAWLMYRLTAESQHGGYKGTHGLFFDNDVPGHMWGMTAKKEYKPKLTIKAKYYHSERENVKFKAGVALNLDATEPEVEIDISRYFGGFWGLGEVPVAGPGYTNRPITVCMDISRLYTLVPMLKQVEKAKFFMSANPAGSGTGNLYQTSIVSYINDEEGEFTPFEEFMQSIDTGAERSVIVTLNTSTSINNHQSESLVMESHYNNITLTGASIEKVMIYAVTGKMVCQKQTSGMTTVVINKSELTQGINIMKVLFSDGSIAVRKVIY